MMGWLELLRDDVARTGSIGRTAVRVGVSRTAVSLALAGKYPSGTGKLAAKVLAALSDRVACPHLGATIARAACADRASRPMPMSSAAELRAWSACQACPNKANQGGSPC